jgi:Rad3-related DNA helicase
MVNEYTCVCMHSDRGVPERRENLQKFKDGEVRFLICTDVAARGIDIRGMLGPGRKSGSRRICFVLSHVPAPALPDRP